MKKCFGLLAALILVFGTSAAMAGTDGTPLATFDYHLVGIGLQAGPDYQAVPKGLPTQVTTGIDAQGFDVDSIICPAAQGLPGQGRTLRPGLSHPDRVGNPAWQALRHPQPRPDGQAHPEQHPPGRRPGQEALWRRAAGGGHRIDQRSAHHRGQDPAADSGGTAAARGHLRLLQLHRLRVHRRHCDRKRAGADHSAGGHSGSEDGGQPRGHPAAAGDRDSPADHRSESPK